jgi:hypothetical protein
VTAFAGADRRQDVMNRNQISRIRTTPLLVDTASRTYLLRAIITTLTTALLTIFAVCALAGVGTSGGSTARIAPSPSPQRTPNACQLAARCP